MSVSITGRLLISLLVVFLLPTLSIQAQDTAVPPIKPALLVIDIQNTYIPMMDQSNEDSVWQMINGAIWLFRNNSLPIIRVYHTDPHRGPVPDSEGFAFTDQVNIEPADPQIIKNYPSAFTKTELHALLQEKGVNTLFLCGLSATGCVLATYFGALDREYEVFMIEGGLMSPDVAQTEMIKDIFDSVGWSSMEMIVRGAVN